MFYKFVNFNIMIKKAFGNQDKKNCKTVFGFETNPVSNDIRLKIQNIIIRNKIGRFRARITFLRKIEKQNQKYVGRNRPTRIVTKNDTSCGQDR